MNQSEAIAVDKTDHDAGSVTAHSATSSLPNNGSVYESGDAGSDANSQTDKDPETQEPQGYVTPNHGLLFGPLILLVMAGAQILDVLNMTGLIFSIPYISQKYNVPADEASWVISAYSLSFGSFILLGGRLGDFIGYKKVFLGGLLAMGICSLVMALAQNVYVLYVFRALQGVGAAFTIPTSTALVAYNFTGRAQAIAMACVGSAAAMGGIIGVIVGGAFTEVTIGYRGLMYLSFGLSILFMIAAFFLVKETPHKGGLSSLKELDFLGTTIAVAGMILVVFGFTSAPGRWKSARVIAPIIIGVLIMLFFPIYEYKISKRVFKIEPLIPRYAWKFPNLKVIPILAPFNAACLYVTLFVGSEQLMSIRAESPMRAAVQFIPFGIGFALACVVGGAMYGRVSPKWMLTIGPIFDIVGAVLWSRVRDNQSFWRYIFTGSVMLSIGTGLFMSTFINAVVTSAPLDHQGVVAGLCMTAVQLGAAITLAIGTSEIGDTFHSSYYANAYYTLIAYAVVAGLLAFFFVKHYESNQTATYSGAEAQRVHEKPKGDQVV
uniref:ARAD1D20680p n=1 Tax=Blastobotrys adeninivorans TaxID=409370 RepID=A0A060TF71_BLAAD